MLSVNWGRTSSGLGFMCGWAMLHPPTTFSSIFVCSVGFNLPTFVVTPCLRVCPHYPVYGGEEFQIRWNFARVHSGGPPLRQRIDSGGSNVISVMIDLGSVQFIFRFSQDFLEKFLVGNLGLTRNSNINKNIPNFFTITMFQFVNNNCELINLGKVSHNFAVFNCVKLICCEITFWSLNVY